MRFELVQWQGKRSLRPRGKAAAQAGFTYVALLFAIAIFGLGLAVVGVLWAKEARRDKEAELRSIGNEFRKAIALYYYRTPGGGKEYPKSLNDLLEDPRYPGIQRYLRKIYADPMTGKPEWGLVRVADGRIAGVYSLSADTSVGIRKAGAGQYPQPPDTPYGDWKFVFEPVAAGGPSTQ